MPKRGSRRNLYAAYLLVKNNVAQRHIFFRRCLGLLVQRCLSARQPARHGKIYAVALFLAAGPLHVHADIIISEIFYDSSGTDSKQEWIELQNKGTSAVDISKWKINDGASHVLNAPPKNGSTGSLILSPGSYSILVADANSFRATHAGISASVIDTSLSLSNDGETISLLNASGTVMTTATYTTADGGAGDGNSLQKSGMGWIAAPPTPGTANATVAAPGPNAKIAPPPKSAKAAKAPKISKAAKSRLAHRGGRKISTPTIDLTNERSPNISPGTPVPLADNSATSHALAQTASVLPANSSWIWAIMALVLVCMGGIYTSRWIAQDEWEIEDVGEED